MSKIKVANEERYEGFTNFKTWEVNLELNNTYKAYTTALQLVRNGISTNDLAKWIKNNNNWQYYNNVNYKEIAEEFIRNYNEEIKPFEDK